MIELKTGHNSWVVLLNDEDYERYESKFNLKNIEISSYYDVNGGLFHTIEFGNDEYQNFKRTNLIDRML
jgi:hypothetical protein